MSSTKLYKEGCNALSKNDMSLALEKFSQGLQLQCDNETSTLLLSGRSAVYLKMNQVMNAIVDAREALENTPRFPAGHIALGKAYEANGDFHEALQTYLNGMAYCKHAKKDFFPIVEKLNKKCQIYSDEIIEVFMLKGEKYCNVCKEMDAAKLSRCSGCKIVYYCCKEHQANDWKNHKKVCKKLKESFQNEEDLERMEVKQGLPLISVRKGKSIPSLSEFTCWKSVWDFLECVACKEDIFRRRISESLSWTMTLVSGLCQFGLDKKKELLVHVVGAEDIYVINPGEGYFSDLLKFFPLPNTKIVLIGPELNLEAPHQAVKFVNGNKFTTTCSRTTWSDFMKNNPSSAVPDIVVGCHPGLFVQQYNWMPCLQRMLEMSIPCVFTSWDKIDFDRMMNIMTMMLRANVKFEGKSPFASPMITHEMRHWNEYMFKEMNCYWVGFKGYLSN